MVDRPIDLFCFWEYWKEEEYTVLEQTKLGKGRIEKLGDNFKIQGAKLKYNPF